MLRPRTKNFREGKRDDRRGEPDAGNGEKARGPWKSVLANFLPNFQGPVSCESATDWLTGDAPRVIHVRVT